MSNWNKVNSEMYSLTDGPYHCIVRESGQMYYCEVFRNDDLILVSTVEGLQEAKNTCEIEILADLQKRGLFNARIAEQSIFGKQSFPIVFDFKDTGIKEDAIKLPKGWYLSADGKEYKRKLGDYAAIVTPLSDGRIFLSVIQHNTGCFTCFDRFDGKAVFYSDTLEESIKLANSQLESAYEADCSNNWKQRRGKIWYGGKDNAIKRHEQAAKAVKDGCKAATEQEQRYGWKKITSNNHSLKHGKFYAMAYSVLGGGWSALVKDEEDDIYVLNEVTDTKQNAKELVEQFLKGYYEGPEAKEAQKTKNPEPFAIIGGYELYTNSGKQKGVEEWSFSAVGLSGEIISYRGFDTKEDAQHSALEWVHSHVFGKSATIEFNSDKVVGRKYFLSNPTEIEETVIAQIRKRRDVGREKYGTTMEREDLSFIQWLQHLQEELLDAAIYAEKLKREHRKELLSDMIADDENSGLYD